MTGLRHLRCKTHYWPLDEEHTPHTPGHVLEKTAPDDSCESISDVSGDLLLAAVAPEGGVWLHLSLHHPRALHLLPRTSHLVSGIHNIHTTRTTHRSKHMGMLVERTTLCHYSACARTEPCASIRVSYLLCELVDDSVELVLVFCREYVLASLVVMASTHHAISPGIRTTVLR